MRARLVPMDTLVNSAHGDIGIVCFMGTDNSSGITGPRGGKTTVTKTGLIRFVAYVHPDERQALRRAAFEREVSASEIVRKALRAYLDVED